MTKFMVSIIAVVLIIGLFVALRNDNQVGSLPNATTSPATTTTDGLSGTTTTPTPVSPSVPITSVKPCYVGGCSGQICSDQPGAVSTCEFRPEYSCYKTATCARQTSGQCGWTETVALRACLDAPPAS